MAKSSANGSVPDAVYQYDVCIIHSGSDIECRLEDFIRRKLDALKLTCGPMNSDKASDVDTALFNDNLKTIKLSKKALLIFSSSLRQKRRCRFEWLFALHLHTLCAHPIIIPVAIGHALIPDKYSVFQEVVVEKSNNWCYKLLRALINDFEDLKDKISNDSFVNEGREIIDMNIPVTTDDLDDSDDFDEFGTAGMMYSKQKTNSCLSNFIGQMGLNNVHKRLMNGCGMSVQKDLISLKWKTFEQNLVCSSVTLADIVNFSEFLDIKRISIKFDKYSHEKIEKHYGENWQQLLVTFTERILKQRFNDSTNELLTYRVIINGIAGNNTKIIVNKTGRSIYIDNFLEHVDEFHSIANRLKTFHNWPSHYTMKPLDLAKAGFIYTGHEDTVTCYSCNQSLYGPTSDDNTYFLQIVGHCYWNDNCKYLQSLPEYNLLKLKVTQLKQFKLLDRSIYYSDIENRIQSFDSTLPKDRCFEFAQAGFFQGLDEPGNIGIECFCCGAEIHFVKLSQDPWVEHIRWSSHCEYVITKKGQKFVDNIRQALVTEDNDDVFTEVIIQTFVIRTEKEKLQESDNTEAICVDTKHILNE